MLTIERVAHLKGVEFFRDTPDYVLAAVGAIIEEVSLGPGETFITEGAVEDSMYVILEGQVRVHRDEKTIITLGPGDSVGELAVLDPEPRAAAVTTVGDVLMFRLDQGSFETVMADRPEIARAVIRALCARIRAQGRTIAELQA